MLHHSSGLPDPRLDAQFYDTVLTKRLLAGLFDFVVVFVLVTVVLLVTLGLAAFLLIPVIFVTSFAYRILFIAKFSATLGMWLMGVELRNHAGHRFDLQDGMLHTGLFLCFALFTPLHIVSLTCMAFTKRSQGLPDLIMGSALINRPA